MKQFVFKGVIEFFKLILSLALDGFAIRRSFVFLYCRLGRCLKSVHFLLRAAAVLSLMPPLITQADRMGPLGSPFYKCSMLFVPWPGSALSPPERLCVGFIVFVREYICSLTHVVRRQICLQSHCRDQIESLHNANDWGLGRGVGLRVVQVVVGVRVQNNLNVSEWQGVCVCVCVLVLQYTCRPTQRPRTTKGQIILRGLQCHIPLCELLYFRVSSGMKWG